MYSLRAVRQVSAIASRAAASRNVSRSLAPSLARSVLNARVTTGLTSRAFSTSRRVLGEGSTDVALSQRLAEELKYETEAATSEEPEFLKAFKSQGTWAIEDIAGNDEVTLTRKFGNEEIRLIFSIADIQNEQEAEFDEGEEGAEESADGSDAPPNSYPIRCSFSFTKGSAPGALTADALCQDGAFVIDNISYYSDKKTGTDLTAEADWKRRGYYLGPQFDTLDVSLQDEFEKFLQERGISQGLAQFVPEYAEFKEQKEYVSWLKNVRDFVDV